VPFFLSAMIDFGIDDRRYLPVDATFGASAAVR
jgi:hypothetical protein